MPVQNANAGDRLASLDPGSIDNRASAADHPSLSTMASSDQVAHLTEQPEEVRKRLGRVHRDHEDQ